MEHGLFKGTANNKKTDQLNTKADVMSVFCLLWRGSTTNIRSQQVGRVARRCEAQERSSQEAECQSKHIFLLPLTPHFPRLPSKK